MSTGPEHARAARRSGDVAPALDDKASTMFGEVADCQETVHQLYHFLDGELTDERRRAIRAHLDSCGDCLDALDFEAELRKVIADHCRDRVPDGLRERIADALRHEGLAADGA